MPKQKNWMQDLKKWRQSNAEKYAQALLQEPVKTSICKEVPFPGVILIMGDRREGKTALAHKIVEDVRKKKRIGGKPPEAVLHLPNTVPEAMRLRIQRMLPGDGGGRRRKHWFHVMTDPNKWPNNSIIVYDEASQSAHARRAQSNGAINLDNMIGISGQRNQLLIFISHHSRKLDLNVVTEVSRIIYKTPTEAHAIFERDEMSDFTYRALDFFEQLTTDNQRKRNALSLTLKPRIRFSQFTNGLAPWWNDELSCLFHEIEMLGKGG